jgi:hypothetical protein
VSHLKKSKEPDQSKPPQSNNARLFMKAMGILIVFLIALTIAKAYVAASVQNDTTITVQKKLGIQPATVDYDIISTDGIRYTMADGRWFEPATPNFPAEMRYDKLQEGGMFTIHTHGISFAPLSMYPNIITIQQALSIEKPCPKNETLEQNHPEMI